MTAWFISLLYVLIKGSLMNHFMPGLIDVDLVTVIMSYLLIRQGSNGAVVFAFVQGIAVDLFSGSVMGFYTFLYLVTFLCLFIGARFFDLLTSKGQIILIFLTVFLKQILLLALLKAFSLEMSLPSSLPLPFALSALLAGLVAPLVFSMFNQMGFAAASDLEEEE